MEGQRRIRSVAIIGAGASGAITAAAFQAENYFDHIRVFERRETPGGTWIYDAGSQPSLLVKPGDLPPTADPPLAIPEQLPRETAPTKQERFAQTPVYDTLTTNVPDIAMSFSDERFAYGPFAPHYVPCQYIGNYFSTKKLDYLLELNTTLEDLSKTSDSPGPYDGGWKLTLRKHDPTRQVDIWWEEDFDAVILANGHYSVPYVPHVKGLDDYIKKFPHRVIHSKSYRNPRLWKNKKVLVIGNSASGVDVTNDVLPSVRLPVYQSRRSKSRWDGDEPPPGIEWKPIITEYKEDGSIIFDDGSVLNDIDVVIYCTGYKPSFPFWNSKVNGRPLYDYKENRLIESYWHTFFRDLETLAVVGFPRVLTFRSMEYQAIALARLYSGRESTALPPVEEQVRWEIQRAQRCKEERIKFHDVPWENGETKEYLLRFYEIAGLGTLFGDGRNPPVLTKDTIWAIENIKKYPDHGKTGARVNQADDGPRSARGGDAGARDWVVVDRPRKDVLSFL